MRRLRLCLVLGGDAVMGPADGELLSNRKGLTPIMKQKRMTMVSFPQSMMDLKKT